MWTRFKGGAVLGNRHAARVNAGNGSGRARQACGSAGTGQFLRRMRGLFLILSGLLLAGAVRAGEAAEAIFVVTGDQHSAYARAAQFVARVDRVRAENPGVPVAVLLNGDSFELGNGIALRSGGEIEFAMFAALARRGPTVLNLGNHEPEFYDPATTVQRIAATGVTVIGNLAHATSGKLFAPASTRLRLGREEIVIAGLTIDVLAQYRAAVRRLLDLTNPEVWAERNFPTLLASAPVAIVMSHAGLRHDREIFRFVPDGTLYLGAHDHTRYVHRLGRTVYVQSGPWNSHVSIVRLRREAHGVAWSVEQQPLRDTDPADPELADVVARVTQQQRTPEDAAHVGRLAHALPRDEAAKFVVEALRAAADVDAAFVGNTTFGDGLPAGEISRSALDACVRFDGTLFVAEVTGAQLQAWLAAANQNETTPFEARRGEFLFAASRLNEILPQQRYRIATTDWGARNRLRYFGSAELAFAERPELRVKTIVAEALSR